MEEGWKGRGGGIEVRIYFLNIPPGILRFVTLPLIIPEKLSFHNPGNSAKLCNTTCNPKIKKQDPYKFHDDFFLNIPEYSTFFLIDPWNFHILFLQYP